MRLLHPEIFQGSLKKKKYFEGWYFKTIYENGVLIVIPGLSIGRDPHAFIQIIEGKTHKTFYQRFPLKDFHAERNSFHIRIGENEFSSKSLFLNISSSDLKISCSLNFGRFTPYTSGTWAPGIMGPYSFVPFMECYHGIVSADHSVNGEIIRDGKKKIIQNGRGYIEKDWGRSMPSSWIWIQSNSLSVHSGSFMLSIAKVPWLGREFNGFLCFLYFKEKYYRFTTYNNSVYEIDDENNDEVSILIKNNKYQLNVVFALPGHGGLLKAPVNGAMQREIRETTDTEISIELSDYKNNCLLKDRAGSCGVEVVGDINSLK